MSTLGILHTAVSVLPLGLGLWAYLRDGRIDPRKGVGQAYVLTMLAGAVSSWGFLFTKGFTPAQGLTLATLALLALGTLRLDGRWRQAGYLQTIGLSTSYFLLWIFTTTETLTRVPRGQPFATSPDDPALLPVRLLLLLAFALGLGYQLLRIHGQRHRASPLGTSHSPRIVPSRVA